MHHLSGNDVRGHCEAAIEGHGTLCPGAWMRHQLAHIRDWCKLQAEGDTRKLGEFLIRNHQAPAPAPATADHKTKKVQIHVKGYLNESTTKAVIETAAYLIGGVPHINLNDLINGLGWGQPEQHEIDADTIVVPTKSSVRSGRDPVSVMDQIAEKAEKLI